MHCPKAPCPKSCSICIYEHAAQMLDSDGSGGLDCDEFCVAMRKLVLHRPRNNRLDANSPQHVSRNIPRLFRLLNLLQYTRVYAHAHALVFDFQHLSSPPKSLHLQPRIQLT